MIRRPPQYGLARLLIGFIASLAMWTAGCASAPEVPPEWVFEADELEQAERDLGLALVSAPDDAALNLRMAALLRQRGRRTEARAHVDEVLRREPRHVRALHLLGLIGLDENKPREAAQDLLTAVEVLEEASVEPDAGLRRALRRALRAGIDNALSESRGREVIGLAEALDDRYDDDRADADRLLGVYLDRAEFLYQAGYYREALGVVDRAERWRVTADTQFRRATALAQLAEEGSDTAFARYVEALPDGERALGWKRVAEHYEEVYDFEGAAQAYARAESARAAAGSEGRPSGVEPGPLALAHGQLLLKMRQFDDARLAFDRYLALLPASEREEATIELVRDLVRFDARDLAHSYLDQAMDADPGSIVPVTAAARLLLRSHPEQAQSLLVQFADRNSDIASTSQAARAAEELAFYDLAVALWKRDLSRPDPRHAAWLDVARVEHAARRTDARDRALQSFVAAAGGGLPAQRAAGLACAEMELEQCALQWLAPVVQAEPSHRESALALAEVEQWRGKSDAAIRVAEAHVAASSDRCAARIAVDDRLGRSWSDDARRSWLAQATQCTDPADESAIWLRLGHIALGGRQPDLDQARLAFRTALDRAPDRANARMEVLDALAGHAGLEGFRADVLTETAESSADAASWLDAARANLEAERFDRAVDAAERYVRASTEDGSEAVAVAIGLFSASARAKLYLPLLLSRVDAESIDDPNVHRDLGMLFAKSDRHRDLARAHSHLARFLDRTDMTTNAMEHLAEEWLELGFADLAARGFRKALVASPQSARVAELLGESYLVLGEVELAEGAFDLARTHHTDESDAMKKIARRWMDHGFAQRAAAMHEELVQSAKRQSDREDSFADWVAALARAGQRSSISEAANVFVAVSSHRHTAVERAAQVLQEFGLCDAALQQYQVLREQGRERHHHLIGEARCELRRGNAAAAEAILADAAGQRSYDGRTVVGIVADLEAAAQWAASERLLSESVERGEVNADVYVHRALARLRQGRLDDAHADAISAMGQTDGPERVMTDLVREFRRAWRLDLAIDLCQRAIVAQPERRASHVQLVDALLSADRYDEALVAHRSLLRDDPNAAHELAPIWADHAQYEEAISLLMSAIDSAEGLGDRKSGGNPANSLRLLGRLLSATGRLAEFPAAVNLYLARDRDDNERLVDAVNAYGEVADISRVADQYEALAGVLGGGEGGPRIGRFRLDEGRVDEAMRWFRESVSQLSSERLVGRDGTTVSDALALAFSELREAGLFDECNRICSAAVARDPESWPLFREWMGCRIATGDAAGVVHDVTEAWIAGRYSDPAAVSEALTWLAGAGVEPELTALVQAGVGQPHPREGLALAHAVLQSTAAPPAARAAIRAYLEHVPAGQQRGRVILAQMLIDWGSAELAIEVATPLAEGSFGEWTEHAVGLCCRGEMALGRSQACRSRLAAHRQRLSRLGASALTGLHTTVLQAWNLQMWPEAGAALESLAALLPPGDIASLVARAGGPTDAALRQVVDRVVDYGRSAQSLDFIQSSAVAWALRMRVGHVQGDPEAARRAAERLVESSIDTAAAWRFVAFAFDAYYDEASALWAIERFERVDASDRELAKLGVAAALQSNRTDKARARADAILQECQPVHSGALVLGHVWLRHGEPDELDWLLEAAADGPDWPRALLQGRRAALAGDVQGATEALNRIMASHPHEWHWSVEDLATIAWRQAATEAPASAGDSRWAAVGQLLARAVLDERPAAYASNALDAIRRLWAGDTGPALAHCERAIGSESLYFLDLVASHALRAGADGVAQRALDRKEALSGGWRSPFDTLRDELGHVAPLIGERAGRIRDIGRGYIQPALDSEPHNNWYATLASDLLEHTDDAAGAERIYVRLVRLLRGDSTVRNNLAYLLARRGDQLAHAAELAQAAQQLDPAHSIYYLDTAGWVAFQTGEHAAAESMIHQSIRLMTKAQGPGASEGFWHWGMALEALGRSEDAQSAYTRAARIDFHGVYGQRARIRLRELESERPAARQAAD